MIQLWCDSDIYFLINLGRLLIYKVHWMKIIIFPVIVATIKSVSIITVTRNINDTPNIFIITAVMTSTSSLFIYICYCFIKTITNIIIIPIMIIIIVMNILLIFIVIVINQILEKVNFP